MVKYKLNKEQPLTPDIIKRLIEKHKMSQVPKYELMDKYYHNENKILSHLNYRYDTNGDAVVDDTKPNNKVSHPYANYITDTLTGYFMGEGITYSSLDEQVLDELNMV